MAFKGITAFILGNNGEGGGGGGTSNYNELSNKPQINGNELAGNKSSGDLGIKIGNVPIDGNAYLSDLEKSYNQITPTYTSQTFHGVTFVVNKDKSITANGTADSDITLTVAHFVPSESNLKLSGTPSDGSSSKYYLYVVDNATSEHTVDEYSADPVDIPVSANDCSIKLRIKSGATCTNVVFKPMVRYSTDPATYIPSYTSNDELESMISNKVDKIAGKVLSSNDYTDADQEDVAKIDGLVGSVGSLSSAVGIVSGKVTTLEGEVLDIEDDLDNLGTAAVKDAIAVVTQSNDLVESGAVYNAIQEFTKKVSNNEVYGLRQGKGNMVDLDIVGGSLAWNQLVEPLMSTVTAGGVTVTNNGDGSFKINGTSGASDTDFRIDQGSRSGANNLKTYYKHKYLVLGIKETMNLSFNVMQNTTWDLVLRTVKETIINVALAGSEKNNCFIYLKLDANISFNNLVVKPQLIDLTQLFGSTIADYIYSLEQATAGAGVEWFKQYFPNDYYAYNAGAIQSVNVESRKVVGKNLYDLHATSNVIQGVTYTVNGDGTITVSGTPSGSFQKFVTYSPHALPSGTYVISGLLSTTNTAINLIRLNKNGNTVRSIDAAGGRANQTLTILDSDDYDTIVIEYKRGVNEPCSGIIKPMITLQSVVDLSFEPYIESVYPFDSTKQLRGIPKLVDNKLNYDGDIYTADGQITRKYGIIDLGTATWIYQADVVEGSITGRFFTSATYNIAKPSSLPLVSRKYKGHIGTEGMVDNCCRIDGSGDIVITDTAYTNAETFKTAMSGVYLVYEFATPTTETAQPYQNPQRAYSDGTEEMVDAGSRDVAVPVGNNSVYYLSDALPAVEDYVDGIEKIITTELEDKANKSDLGTASTKNSTSVVTQSTDLVESGAVKDAIVGTVGWIGGNFINPDSYLNDSYSPSGLTMTIDDEGIITINGTSQNQVVVIFIGHNSDPILTVPDTDASYVFSCGYTTEGNYGLYFNLYNGSTQVKQDVATLYGVSEKTVDLSPYTFDRIVMGFYCPANTPFNNVKLKPMISKRGGSFVPYHASVEESLAERVNWINAKGYVGRNILPYPKGTRQTISSTGVITDNPEMYLSDYVSVDGIESLNMTCEYASVNIGVRIACFDGAKNFIKRDLKSPTPNNPIVYQIGSGIKYVRFCIEDNPYAYYTNLMIEDSEIPIKTYETYVPTNTELDSEKCDNSVIGTVEDGATASQAYAVGEHFIRGGKFCTVTQPIASGGTLTEGTNYTSGDVADDLNVAYSSVDSLTIGTISVNSLVKIGKIINLNIRLSGVTVSGYTEFGDIPSAFRPKDSEIEAIGNVGGGPALFVIKSNGKLISRTAVTNSNIFLNAFYICN